MAHTLRSLATDKVVKKVDGFRARLADLISCVRELRESVKPLDADKQSEMEI